MKTPSIERHQLCWLADLMPCTSRWPRMGWPYCSPVTLRKTSVPMCLKRTASSRSQWSPSHCTVHKSRSSPSPFSPKALTSCRMQTQMRKRKVFQQCLLALNNIVWLYQGLIFAIPLQNTKCVPLSHLVIRKGWAKVMCVEVSASLHVCDSDSLTTLDGDPALTWTVGFPSNLPVTVGIICALHSSNRLLSTAYTCRVSDKSSWILFNTSDRTSKNCVKIQFQSLMKTEVTSLVPWTVFEDGQWRSSFYSIISEEYGPNSKFTCASSQRLIANPFSQLCMITNHFIAGLIRLEQLIVKEKYEERRGPNRTNKLTHEQEWMNSFLPWHFNIYNNIYGVFICIIMMLYL